MTACVEVPPSRDLAAIGLGTDKRWGRVLRYSLLLALALAYLSSITPNWFDTSDSALYLMLAENLRSGEGYTLWGYPHVHVPPGFPAMLAALDAVGMGSPLGLNLALLATGLVTLYVAYAAVRELRNEEQAFLVVVVVLAFSCTMHRASVRILSDLPFMLLVCIGMLGYARGTRRVGGAWLELGTLALLASLWIRVVGLPLAGAAACGLLVTRSAASRVRAKANAAVLLLGTGATGLFFYSYQQHYARDYDLPSYQSMVGSIGKRSSLQVLWQPVEQLLQTGGHLSELLTGQPHASLGLAVGLLWIPVALGVWAALRRREYLPVAVLVGYLGPILVVRALLPRYLLPVAPLLILYLLDGVRISVERLAVLRRFAPRIVVTCCLVMLAMNVPKCISMINRLQWTRVDSVNGPPAKVREVADFMRQHARQGDRFVSAVRDRQLGYLSHVPSIPSAARYLETGKVDDKGLQFWLDRGVVFVVNAPKNNSVKPENRRTIKRICQQNGLEVVFSNRTYVVYSTRPQQISQSARKLAATTAALSEKP